MILAHLSHPYEGECVVTIRKHPHVYADVSALTQDSSAFSRQLLAETGVAVTPGRDFDPIHGDSWIRLSTAVARVLNALEQGA